MLGRLRYKTHCPSTALAIAARYDPTSRSIQGVHAIGTNIPFSVVKTPFGYGMDKKQE
jgi:hypothetical protein